MFMLALDEFELILGYWMDFDKNQNLVCGTHIFSIKPHMEILIVLLSLEHQIWSNM